jgi:hypothetical protein
LLNVSASPLVEKEINSRYYDKNTRFYARQHNKINKENLEKVLREFKIRLDNKTLKRWEKLLNKAVWYQDIFHFFGSKHHFDNCCFAESIEQIINLQKDNDADYAKLLQIQKEKERVRLKEKIIFRTGRILHSAQDFFSHSNFVELMQEKYDDIKAVPAIEFLIASGQTKILDLSKNGLYSGKFFFSFPHKCEKDKIGNQNFNKDGPNTRAGKLLTKWRNLPNKNYFSNFEAAMFFADRSTFLILHKIFSDYPLLTKTNSQNL